MNSSIINKIKQEVINEIISNNDIVEAIDNKDMKNEDWTPLYLLDVSATRESGYTPSVYTFIKVPSTVDTNATVLCVAVDEYGDSNSPLVEAKLTIYIITHKEHMYINSPTITENRNDYIGRLLDLALNGKKDVALGKIFLSSSTEVSYDETFLMRTLIFRCSDISNSACNNA